MKSKKVTNQFISIQKYDKETLVNLILERHREFLNQTNNVLYFSTIWGKMQAGKTNCIDILCDKYSNQYNHSPMVTTTLDDKSLNEQLKSDLGVGVNVIKITELNKMTDIQITNELMGCRLLLLDEGDYGMKMNGRVSKLIAKLIKLNKMHIVFFGATNYAALLAELNDFADKKVNSKHFGLQEGDGYYGIQELQKEGRILDINSDDYMIDVNTGKIPKKTKDLIIKQHKEQSGLSLIRNIKKNKKDKKAITLCDSIADNIQKDKDFQKLNFIIIKMYDDNERTLVDELRRAQRLTLMGKNVLIIAISGLKAGIAFDAKIKQNNKLRFWYDSQNVASSSNQSIGRFCIYLGSDGKIPTPIILCNKELADYYIKIWDSIDKNGGVSVDDILHLSKGKKPTSHSNQKKILTKANIPAKLVFKGDWNMIDTKIKQDSFYTTSYRERKKEESKKEFKINFDKWYKQWKDGKEIYVNNYASGDIGKNQDKYNPYFIFIDDSSSNKKPVMVFEITDTNVNKEAIVTLKIIGKDTFTENYTN
jgi:hypothetical protein